jgi:ABC-2 type transport system permease protein
MPIDRRLLIDVVALRQSIAESLSLAHYTRHIRGILLRGADISSLTGELIALSTFLIVTLSLAIRRFRKRLD